MNISLVDQRINSNLPGHVVPSLQSCEPPSTFPVHAPVQLLLLVWVGLEPPETLHVALHAFHETPLTLKTNVSCFNTIS